MHIGVVVDQGRIDLGIFVQKKMFGSKSVLTSD